MDKIPLAIDVVAQQRGLRKILALNDEGEYLVVSQTQANQEVHSEDYIVIEDEDAEELLNIWQPIKETDFQIKFWQERGQ
jgi:hypothetical protein